MNPDLSAAFSIAGRIKAGASGFQVSGPRESRNTSGRDRRGHWLDRRSEHLPRVLLSLLGRQPQDTRSPHKHLQLPCLPYQALTALCMVSVAVK